MKNTFLRLSQSKAAKGLAVAGIALASTASHAAIDVSAATTAIGDATVAASALGGAVLAVMVVIGTFVWLRRPVK